MSHEIPFESAAASMPVGMEAAKREMLNLLQERTVRIKKRYIDQFFTDEGPNSRDNYRKHIQFFNAGRDYRERAIFGGNRSTPPDALIDTVDGPVPVREVADGSSVDVVSWDGERLCSAPMSGWFLKGFEPMYRVLLDNGLDFVSTARHRLLADDGQFYALYELLGRTYGARCWGRAGDFLASCAPDGYQYDAAFLLRKGSDPVLAPLQDGVRKLSLHVSPEDAMARTLPHSRACLTCDHQSTHGDLRPLEALFDLFSSRVLPHASQGLREIRQELQPFLAVSYAQLLSGGVISRRQSFLPGCKAVLQSHDVVSSHEESFQECSRPERFVFGCNLDELAQQFARDAERIPMFLTLGNRVLFGGVGIVAVIPVGYQPVIGETVSGTHNYRSGGVFHANSGKSIAACYELAVHLIGEYPHWWAGKRFARPVQGLACGKEAKITRDTVQQILLGKQGEFGTGLIPGENLDRDKCTASRAASGLFDGVQVKHKSGGWSMLRFRSYDQGRTAFEGVERDVIIEDEEAPLDVHSENLMRTMTTGGITILSFTPLKGETPLVTDLMRRAKEGTVFTINVWWDDVGHITREMIDDMKGRYPNHELRARRFGEPQLGTGAIFTQDPDSYTLRHIDMPEYWAKLYGLDFGWVHPTAALWMAHDRETNIVYAYAEYRRSLAEPSIHIAAIKARGEWIPGVSETAGTNASDGKRMLDIFKKGGCKLRPVAKKATAVAGFVESSIMLIQERLSIGTLKILETCPYLLEELRRYHRDENGKVVNKVDDLIAALRYGLTGLKYARTEVETRGSGSGDNIREVNFYGRRRMR